jgi:hypothetical protein
MIRTLALSLLFALPISAAPVPKQAGKKPPEEPKEIKVLRAKIEDYKQGLELDPLAYAKLHTATSDVKRLLDLHAQIADVDDDIRRLRDLERRGPASQDLATRINLTEEFREKLVGSLGERFEEYVKKHHLFQDIYKVGLYDQQQRRLKYDQERKRRKR